MSRYFGGPGSWSSQEAEILPLARGRVLNIGCGAGRHMVALRERGIEVNGVDPSPGAVAVCRERGLTAAVGDIDRLPAGPFDTLLLFGNNLALLGSSPAAVDRLAGLAAVAAPGCGILGSNVDPYRYDQPGAWFDYWFASVDELNLAVARSPWHTEAILPESRTSGIYAAVLVLRD